MSCTKVKQSTVGTSSGEYADNPPFVIQNQGNQPEVESKSKIYTYEVCYRSIYFGKYFLFLFPPDSRFVRSSVPPSIGHQKIKRGQGSLIVSAHALVLRYPSPTRECSVEAAAVRDAPRWRYSSYSPSLALRSSDGLAFSRGVFAAHAAVTDECHGFSSYRHHRSLLGK